MATPVGEEMIGESGQVQAQTRISHGSNTPVERDYFCSGTEG